MDAKSLLVRALGIIEREIKHLETASEQGELEATKSEKLCAYALSLYRCTGRDLDVAGEFESLSIEELSRLANGSG